MTVLGRNGLVVLTLLVMWLVSEASLNDAQPPLESVSQYGQTDFTTKENKNNSDAEIRVGDIQAVPGDVRMRRLAKAEAKAVPKNGHNFSVGSDEVFYLYNPNGSDYYYDSHVGYLHVPDFPPYDYGRAMRVGVASVWALALSGLVAIAVLLTP